MSNEPNEHPEETIELEPETATDDIELEEVESKSDDKIATLRKKLAACDTEKKDLLEELQRTKAEFLNAKKRLEDQAKAQTERATDDFIVRLLPLCDSFSMAMSNKDVWESVDENWRKGIEAINNQLQTLLNSYDVAALDPTGDQFDPEKHEALGTEENEAESETVIKTIQFGYERNGHIIRPAKVILSQ